MTTSSDLAARYRRVLPSFLAPYYAEPIAIDHGEGSYVYDLDGGRYLDFFGGVLTTMIGHRHPAVTAAVQEQADKVLHTSTLYLSEPMIEFAEMVAEVSGIPDARVYFTPSGSEANDAALLFATSYRTSNQILAIRNSYHGRVFSTQAITSHSSWRSTSHSGLQVQFVHGGYRLRSPFRDLDDDAYTAACVDDLVQVLDMTSAGDVAAMIAEPIQGVGGFAAAPDGLFGAFGKELSNRGILFISDEVQTGWGRTGDHFWGYQAHDIVPDMLTFAKGVGNGITLAGIVARAEIMDTIDVLNFSTFGGNPLSAAAGAATLRTVLGEGLQANAKAMGEHFEAAMSPVAASTPWIAEMRGRGLMWAFEVCEPGTIEPDKSRTGEFHEACRRHGLLVGKGGLYGNVVRLAPMLNVSADEIDEGVAALRAAIADVA
ncbi:aspartate aminotransferase family protein [Ilumatobacter sp.]|uniref:aspartate aminotransferase family protein n=1 Tax=Ilumatobacter sp. TaxID=1967498 RepID=UPI003AF91319